MIDLPPRIAKKPRRDGRIRCPGHLAYIRTYSCAACHGTPSVAAHVRNGTDGGTGLQPGDNWTIPLCRSCHARQHQIGEQSFERHHRIDMRALAAELWRKSPARQRYEAKRRKLER